MFCSMTIVGNLVKDAEDKGEWVVMRVACRPMPKSESLFITVRTKMKWPSALTKGTRILASGTPAIGVWNSNEGAKPDVTLFANTIMNLSPREASQDMPQNIPAPQYAPAMADDDVPFRF
jgi:hypothetical protein